MLSEREKCGSEGVPLLASFALKNILAAASGVPPAIAEGAPVKQAHEREQPAGATSPEFAEEGSPRHAVVGTAALWAVCFTTRKIMWGVMTQCNSSRCTWQWLSNRRQRRYTSTTASWLSWTTSTLSHSRPAREPPWTRPCTLSKPGVASHPTWARLG